MVPGGTKILGQLRLEGRKKFFLIYSDFFFFDFENIGGPTGGRMGRASSTMVCTRHQSSVYMCECVVLGGGKWYSSDESPPL
jgi:hypothetical protein